MPKFGFQPAELRTAIALARIVKPETMDLSFTFSSDCLTIFSYDKRRWSCARVKAESVDSVEPDYESSEYFISLDRVALFESDLTSVVISVNEKSLTVKATDGDQDRNASLKKKSIRSKRPSVPSPPSLDYVEIKIDEFMELLTQVSCSALVKDTKTEEEMRVNQVHFYRDSGHAISNARYYGSVVCLKGIDLDISIVSSDIPVIKTFCARISGNIINIGYDDHRIYLKDVESGSILAMSRIPTKKPPLSILDPSGFRTLITADKDQFLKCLSWSQMAIEGTQRLSVKCRHSESGSDISLYNGSEEISKFPVEFEKGSLLEADFPVNVLHQIVKHVDGKVALGYDHPEATSILGIFEHDNDKSVQYVHYLRSMVPR